MAGKKLSVIIPVFNEEKTLAESLARIFKASVSDYEKEVIIIDDGSTDGSLSVLNEMRSTYPFFLLKHAKNVGKGAAIRSGFKAASGDIVLIQDADLEYDPSQWQLLLKEFENPDVLAVFGSRNMNPKRRGYWHYVFGVKLLTMLVNRLFGSKLTDVYTCYKAFRKSILDGLELKANGFEIEAEITAKLLKKGLAIKEVPIDYFPRKFFEGKKIKFQDGLKGFWMIVKSRIFR
ncbi:MAG: glycosyltransferase family 2 protein [Patescibacteria group bacterium]|jgi:glycosyltransferase involved in cell wall biosynthesis